MPSDTDEIDPLSTAVKTFLTKARDELHRRKIDRVRLYPLILRGSLESLIARRHRIFDTVQYKKADTGYVVDFVRKLKRSHSHPDGRICSGQFDILSVSDKIAIVCSTLRGDDHKYGPARFAEKAYPLARRPFFPSSTLVRLIEQYARVRKATAISRDATGYHRKSQRFRRDMDAQSPAEAAREMAEQGRQIHRLLVGFSLEGKETSRLAFDRNAGITILKGNPLAALKELALPGVTEALAMYATYEVPRTEDPLDQQQVRLDFSDEPFDTYDAMHALCDAIRHGDGLNVGVVHLNPYLHAQVLDFFTGAAIDVLVTDPRTVTLVPRSSDCSVAFERIATTIYRYFGEAKATRMGLTEFVS